jgi:hypothetical protein
MFQINNNINLKKIVIVSKTKWSIFLYSRLILRTLSGKNIAPAAALLLCHPFLVFVFRSCLWKATFNIAQASRMRWSQVPANCYRLWILRSYSVQWFIFKLLLSDNVLIIFISINIGNTIFIFDNIMLQYKFDIKLIN